MQATKTGGEDFAAGCRASMVVGDCVHTDWPLGVPPHYSNSTNATEHEQAGNTCPECHGSGVATYVTGYGRDWETGEYLDYEEEACFTCRGEGLIFDPAETDFGDQE